MTVVWFIVGVVLMLLGAVCSIGAVLPREHVASRSIVVPAASPSVWDAIRTVGEHPSWRPGVKAIDGVEGPPAAPTAWVEHASHGAIRLVLDRADPGRVLEAHVDSTGQPFGGTWTWELTSEGGGEATRVRITERGFVNPAPFRFLSKFVFGHTTTIRGYLGDLHARFAPGGARGVDVD